MVIYDLAGHTEYHSSHSAIMETVMQQSPERTTSEQFSSYFQNSSEKTERTRVYRSCFYGLSQD